ncbi:MAG: histidinol-phosphate transaminase [Gammaproteobacteria bacterium]|nr:histidinol-phosphate transaminase [Gammaproteobacteria bacterium]
MTFERSNIAAMQGYTWGEQPQDARTIKLNTNENPYPASPKVQEALAAFTVDSLRRYPEPTARKLREALAKLHGLTPDHFIITNGGDEALRLALTTFVDPGATFSMAVPSYSLYGVLAQIQDARLHTIPLNDDWSMPADMGKRLRDAQSRLTCLVNPHAPSGTLTPQATYARIARETSGVLLVDEAYVDFVDPALNHDNTSLVREHHNVLLLRTFSKGYGLAGLRLGYLIGAPELIAPMMWKTRDSYNMNHLSQTLGLAAVEDQAWARSTWAKVRTERARVQAVFENLGFPSPPSESNFILVRSLHGSARPLYEGLKAAGILVRYFDSPGLTDRLRITIGTPEENHRLITAFKSLI